MFHVYLRRMYILIFFGIFFPLEYIPVNVLIVLKSFEILLFFVCGCLQFGIEFSLHVVSFFSFLLPWLISSFMPLWSEKMCEIISILLNLLILVLCPSMWSILENVQCVLEKNVYSDVLGCNVLKISRKSNFSIVSFRISVALLIFCLEDLST